MLAYPFINPLEKVLCLPVERFSVEMCSMFYALIKSLPSYYSII